MQDLLRDIGDIKSVTMLKFPSGLARGVAEVIFARRQDAEEAVRQFDNELFSGSAFDRLTRLLLTLSREAD